MIACGIRVYAFAKCLKKPFGVLLLLQLPHLCHPTGLPRPWVLYSFNRVAVTAHLLCQHLCSLCSFTHPLLSWFFQHREYVFYLLCGANLTLVSIKSHRCRATFTLMCKCTFSKLTVRSTQSLDKLPTLAMTTEDLKGRFPTPFSFSQIDSLYSFNVPIISHLLCLIQVRGFADFSLSVLCQAPLLSR